MPCVNIIFSLLCLFGLFLKKKKNDHYKQSLPLLKKTQRRKDKKERERRGK